MRQPKNRDAKKGEKPPFSLDEGDKALNDFINYQKMPPRR